ncbi:hypothetical protein [Nocardioides sp. YIM 152315]|uniref:hypothetical protein n=1 Tax=Nocardioides sp. YIM 152315 TaxID=3031760 RepID=UPI0023DCB77D|nr:hypothetical protein [Nocardioides sp. YIM 152315]MDF1603828.1 hypothetical protein [Nocardioides sp. YIM 152315]
MRFRRERPPVRVERGEKLLADAAADDAHLGGTRDALYVVRRLGHDRLGLEETVRIPWEEVQAADWDKDSATLRISEVGAWGEQRPEHVFALPEPGRLLELVRERVTASVVLQRHVPVDGRRGLRVIARRAPSGDRPIAWFYEYDEGVDPDDPDVRRAAQEALAAARAEVGPD